MNLGQYLTSYRIKAFKGGGVAIRNFPISYHTDFRLVRQWPRFWKRRYEVVDLNPKAKENTLKMAQAYAKLLVARGFDVLIYEEWDHFTNVLIGVNEVWAE